MISVLKMNNALGQSDCRRNHRRFHIGFDTAFSQLFCIAEILNATVTVMNKPVVWACVKGPAPERPEPSHFEGCSREKTSMTKASYAASPARDIGQIGNPQLVRLRSREVARFQKT